MFQLQQTFYLCNDLEFDCIPLVDHAIKPDYPQGYVTLFHSYWALFSLICCMLVNALWIAAHSNLACLCNQELTDIDAANHTGISHQPVVTKCFSFAVKNQLVWLISHSGMGSIIVCKHQSTQIHAPIEFCDLGNVLSRSCKVLLNLSHLLLPWGLYVSVVVPSIPYNLHNWLMILLSKPLPSPLWIHDGIPYT